MCNAAGEAICKNGVLNAGLKNDAGQLIIPSGEYMANGQPLTISNLTDALPKSPLGGLQGSADQLGLLGVTFNYAPGSFTDKLVESFAGPHDFLNSTHYYDALGNNIVKPGLWGADFWNALNIPLAAPMGIATLCTQIPGMCDGIANANRNANALLPTPPVIVLPPSPTGGSSKPESGS